MNRVYKEIPGMFDGPILPLTIKLGLPILIGNIIQLFYALIDTYFISRIDPSSTALLSGTGIIFPIFFLFMSIGASLSVGISSLVGRAIGERNNETLKHVIASGLLVALLIAIPALCTGYLFGDHVAAMLAGSGMTHEALGYGLNFMHWLLPGMAILLVGQIFMGVLQGEGLTKIIAIYAVLSTVINIILDPILIFGCHMGVAGAGLATSLSVTAGVIFVIIYFTKGQTAVPFNVNLLRAQWHLIREIVRIGFPHFLSMASMAISFMLFNKLVSGLTQDMMNAWTLVGRMDQIVLIPSFAFAGATISMIAQNYGRQNFKRVQEIYRKNVTAGVIFVAVVAFFYIMISPYLFQHFSTVPSVIATAASQVHFVSFTFIGVCAAIVSSSSFQATGKPIPALILSLIRMGVISLPVSFILVLHFHWGIKGVWAGLALGNLTSLPFSVYWAWHHLKRLEFKPVGA